VDLTKIALLQVDSSTTTPIQERIQNTLQTLEATLKDQPKLIMLPELWATGAFMVEQTKSQAKEFLEPTLEKIKQLAKKYETWIHTGSFLEATSSGTYNTSYLLDDRGEEVAKYRKIHLFGFDEGEASLLIPGKEIVVVPTPIGITGLTTCYDLRFPELFRAMIQQGANSFLITSGWPKKRLNHWNALLKARAIENQAYVIACNGIGLQTDNELGGNSQVIDPWGEVQIQAQESEETLFTEIDIQKPSLVREKMPVLADRVINQ
jgi:predicted amidohydrolase